METIPEDKAMKRAHRMVWLAGAAFSLGGLSLFGSSFGAGVFVGALIASLNLQVLSKSVRSVVEEGRSGWAGAAVLKFLVLLAVTYGLLDRGYVQPLALAVGFGALPLGILLSGTLGVPLPSAEPSAPESQSP